MKDYNVEPVESLTVNLIEKLIIHATESSLRRVTSSSACVKKVDGNQNLPTLYYIKNSSNVGIDDWTIHTLVSDVNQYLLVNLYSDSENTPSASNFVRSALSWDNFTGKTDDQAWATPVISGENNEVITFNGVIAWYEEDIELGRSEGNRVGVQITPSEEMLLNYPNATIYIKSKDQSYPISEDINEYPELEYDASSVYYYPLISSDGEFEDELTITWDKEAGIVETFKVIVSADSTLEVKQDVE